MKARTTLCPAVRTQLISTGTAESLSGPLASHAAACLRCQAEVVRTQRLHKALAEMGGSSVSAPVGFAEEVLDALDRSPLRRGSRAQRTARVAAAAGALAAAAGTIAVIGWMRTRSAA